MEDWLKWGFGLAITLLVTVVSYIMNKQSSDVRAIHARIDDVKDKYVRRDDFETFRKETRDQLQRIEDKTDRILAQTKH